MINQIKTIHNDDTGLPFKDGLTGLFTQGFFLIYLEQECLRVRRYGGQFTLAMVDIDAFAFNNPKHGPGRIRQALQTVGQAIHKNIRSADIASRFADERFAVLFVGTGVDYALTSAERIRVCVEAESNRRLTVSIGLSSVTNDWNKSPEQMFQEAESALAQAKFHGRNTVYRYQTEEKNDCDVRPRILLVDDDPLNLKFMAGLLKPLGYATHEARTGADALCIMQKTEIDLVLLDIMMPVMDGFEVCSTIKTSEETRMTPVILLTALDDVATKVRGIEAGADDFITKPPHKLELIARVKSLIRLKRLNSNLTSIENVLFSMAKTVEAKDSYTQGHVDRVSELAISIGRKMRLSKNELEALRFGGALHDIGKLGVPEEILNKPGPLNAEEWAIMKTHPEIGYQICLPLKKNLGQALDIVRHHHEKLDGSGYPDNLMKDEISTVTRIMTIADIYDALVTDRPYRKGMAVQKALEILDKESNEGKIDKDVTAFLVCLITGA